MRHPNLGAGPIRAEDVPPDLQRRIVREYNESQSDIFNQQMLEAAEASASLHTLSRGLLGRNVSVGTDQALLVRAERLRSYLFLNPAVGTGLTTTVTGLAQVVVTGAGSGNTRTTPIDVSTYREAHIFVDLVANDAGASDVTIYAEAQDPVSENWAVVQAVNLPGGGGVSTGTFYYPLGTVGVTDNLAFSYITTGDATFSIGVVLKDGLSRSPAEGVTNAVYLGPDGVTTSSGYPLLEGQERAFHMKENVELYAIGKVTGLSIRVFEL